MLGMHSSVAPGGELLMVLSSVGRRHPLPEGAGGGVEAAARALPQEELRGVRGAMLEEFVEQAVQNGANLTEILERRTRGWEDQKQQQQQHGGGGGAGGGEPGGAGSATPSPPPLYISGKNPFDVMHLGLFHLVFPSSPVVVLRRDPRDAGLSMYMQSFAAGDHPTYFSTRLADIADYILEFERTVAHWEAVGVPILQVDYARLVRDPEAVLREVLAWVGLEWEEGVLQFHTSSRPVLTASNEQVRRPLYTSSLGKWRRYRPHLAPLLERLGYVDDGSYDGGVDARVDVLHQSRDEL